jgi:hypothetical protein
MLKDIRRHRRIPLVGIVRLVWEDERGETRYAQGQCIDVSEGGLLVEVRTPIAARTRLTLNAERIQWSGSASVRHVERYGSKYILGLELSGALREKTLEALRAPAGIV